MRAATLLLILLPAATLAAPLPRPATQAIGKPTPKCTDQGVTYTNRGTPKIGPQKLGDLPPANHYLAVHRIVDGCVKPIVVSTGIGQR